MDSDTNNQQCNIPSLGQPFSLGMLYNLPKEERVSALTLWDKTTLDSSTSRRQSNNFGCNFQIVASDTTVGRLVSAGIDGDISLSILSNLVKVAGSAKFFLHKKTSQNVARVTLQYNVTSHFEELSMENLANIQHPQYLEQLDATHVVTGIQYGAVAFFVFEKELDATESRKEVEGKMETQITLIPKAFVGGELGGGVHGSFSNDKSIDNFSCKFFGDIVPDENPSNYHEAIRLYMKLPTLLGGENYSKTVPKVIYLSPLDQLMHHGSPVIQSIARRVSNSIVTQTHQLLGRYESLEEDADSVTDDAVVQKFENLRSSLCRFKTIVSCLKRKFQKQLANLLPEIRSGKCCESKLADVIIGNMSESPVSIHTLSLWLESKRQEAKQLKQYLDIIPQSESVTDAFGSGEFNRFIIDPSQDSPVISLHIATIKNDPVLDCFERECESSQCSISTEEAKVSSWATDESTLWSLRQKTRQFVRLISANRGRKVRFVVTDNVEGSTTKIGTLMLCLFEGESVKKRELESLLRQPGKPIPVSVTGNKVVLNWKTSQVGSPELVRGYKVCYRVCVSSAADSEWRSDVLYAQTNSVTVTMLSSDASHEFKVVPDCGVFLGEESETAVFKTDRNIAQTSSSKPARPVALKHFRIQDNEIAAKDTGQYRNRYPGKKDYPGINHNYEFFTNRRKSEPKGELIDTMHKQLFGDHQKLQFNDHYMQWLFPIRTSGVNPRAKELQLHEVKKIKGDGEAIERFIKSYELMLDFFGLKLTNRKTGEVARASNWERGLRNLSAYQTNRLKVTRILKCLGEFGLDHFQLHLVKHLLREMFVQETVKDCLESCLHYWIEVIRNDTQRDELYRLAVNLDLFK